MRNLHTLADLGDETPWGTLIYTALCKSPYVGIYYWHLTDKKDVSAKRTLIMESLATNEKVSK